MKNTIVFVLILFLFVSLVGVVCASEDSAMDNITLDNTKDSVSQTTDVLQVADDDTLSATHDFTGSTLQDLQDYLNSGNVQDGDTVYLGNSSLSFSGDQWGFQGVDVNIPNLIISGGSSSNPDSYSTIAVATKIFKLSASGITLKNINFSNNGNEGPWCSVNIQNSDCKVTNCNFDNCRNQYGAAVSASDAATNTVIDNCNFTNNRAIWTGNAGAINLNGDSSTVSNCNFENNVAANGGAIFIQNGRNIKIKSCNFTGNSVTDGWSQGGAINSNGEGLVIDDCYFIDNDAKNGAVVFSNGEGSEISESSFGGSIDLNVIGGSNTLTPTLSVDLGNAISGSTGKSNLYYWDGESKSPIDPSEGTKFTLPDKKVTVEVYDSNGNLVDNFTDLTDSNGQITYDYSDLPFGDYNYIAYYNDDPSVMKRGKLYTLVSGNFSGIQAAIDAANPGDTLYLVDDVYYNDISGSMVIDKPLTIIGLNKTVLNAENKSGIFHINDNVNNVVLQNMTMINGNSTEHGGAIYIGWNANDGIIDNVTFANNTAAVSGGAIRNQGGQNWVIQNSTFTNNSAYGETNEINHGGGAIWSCNTVTDIKNSTFVDNKAPYGGALRGPFNIYDSEFDNNTATDGNGGAIDVATDASLAYGLVLEFVNSNFTNNDAKGKRSDDRAQGGAIHIFEIQEVDMLNCICINNTADRGGAVDFYKMNITYVDDCIFVNNNASSEGGGLAIFCDNSTFKDVNVSNNNAGTDGGAIWVIGSNSKFINVTSTNNTASRGGSSYIEGENTLMVNSTLDNNKALDNGTEGSGVGGAVYILGDNAFFDNVNSTDNTAKYGGSSYVEGDNTVIQNCKLDGNNATMFGGGLHVSGRNCSFENVSVSDCHADYFGGAIYVSGNKNNFTNVTSLRNNAESGGSTYIVGNNTIVRDSKFNNNEAILNWDDPLFNQNGWGGGIVINGSSTVFDNNEFTHNAAFSGGGIVVNGNNTLFTNNNITFNEAEGFFSQGGGIYVEGSNTNLTHNNISSNKASDNGGGVYSAGSNLYMEDIYAYNNTAQSGGFAEIASANNLVVKNSTFKANHATGVIDDYYTRGLGGAFHIYNSLNADIQADFFDNTAVNGSAIYIEGWGTDQRASLNVHDSKFFDNQAKSYYLLAAPKNGTVYHADDDKIVSFSHIGGDNIANAIHSRDNGKTDITIRNITFPFYHNGVLENRTTPNVDLTPVLGYENYDGNNIYLDDLEDNQVIYYEVYDNETGEKIRSGSARTDINGSIDINLTDLGVGVYIIKAGYNETTYYTEISNETVIIVVSDEDISINITKVWNDTNNQDGLRPANITIRLYADGVLINSTVLNESNNWKCSFADLPAYDGKHKIVYTVSEVNVDNYTVSVTNSTLGNYTITNTHVPETTSVNVTKVWNDSNNQDGLRPENITVLLFDGDNQVASIVLNESNNWKGNFTGLPVYRNGKKIVYSIGEVSVDNYTVSITNSTLGNYTLTNTHVPEVTSVNVTKIWNDSNNQDGLRPVKVTVELWNDTGLVGSIDLTNATGWKGNFTDLPVYSNGAKINYTVKEVKVANYTVSVTNSTLGNYTLTNTHVPEVTSVNVTKIWNDSNNQDGLRPAVVTVELWNDTGLVGSVDLTNATGWKGNFTNLPVYSNGSKINYTVKEVKVDNYSVSVTNSTLGNYTLTNTHVPEVTSVNVTKIWNDSNNQDGLRPAVVTVELWNDTGLVGSVDLTNASGWKGNFTNLPVYSNGSKINYTVKEVKVANYTVSVTNSTLGNYTLTNTHVPEVTSVNVTKIWNDSNNQDGLRPSKVTVELWNDTGLVGRVVLNEANKWKGNFTDLPVYSNGAKINYTVKEVSVDNYAVSVTNSTLGNYTITNTHVPEVTSVNVTKLWNDSNNQDGLRPAVVTVELWNDTGLVGSIDLTNATGWKGNFTNLPVYSNGTKINYTVKEVKVDNYTVSVTNSTLGNYTITNTHVPETTSVNVTKLWNDSNNQDGLRPSKVTVELWNDTGLVGSIDLTNATGWKGNFTNLPVYSNGTKINYTVKEVSVDNYAVSVTNSTLGNYTLTNTHVPEVTSVNVTKVWNDSNNQDGLRPVKVTVELWNDTGLVGSVDLTNATGWKGNFTNLPVYSNGAKINYTVKEVKVANYTVSVTNSTLGNYTIINTHVPETTSVNVTKLWNDSNNQDGLRPSKVIVELWNDTGLVGSVELTNASGWKGNFTNLPVYSNGAKINYTVKEVKVANYTVSVTNSTLGNYTLTNTHVPEVTSVNVTKIWNDSNNQDGLRPVKVIVELWNDTGLVGSVDLTNASGWKGNFTDLPVYSNGAKINYTVKEVKVANYTVSVTNSTLGNYTLTNTHVPETTSVNVTKIWNDSDNQDGLRPPVVTVELWNDTGLVGSVDLTNATGWKGNFTDLPVYSNGAKINYTVKEVKVANYTVSVTNSTLGNYTLTNTHVPEVTSVNVTKIWNDSDNQDGLRPPVVTVELWNDTALVGTIELTNASGWKGNFTDLPVYSNGAKINYTVKEVKVANYTVSVTNSTLGNYTITNTHVPETTSINVTKVWNDMDDYDGIRPDNVTVVLLADDDEYGRIVLNDNTGWKGNFSDLPVYKDGKKITYSVKEIEISNYTSEITQVSNGTFVIKNTHNPICDLVISKYVNATKVFVNDTVEWNITLVNKGPSHAVGVVVNDTLPDGLKIVSSSVTAGRFDEKTRIWKIDALDVNHPVFLILVTQVVTNGTFTNVVVVNSTTPDSNETNNKANNTTEADPICDLEIKKLVSSKKAYVGEELTWTIIVINHGPSDAFDVKVQEDIPSSLRFISYTATKGKYDKNSQVWTIGKLESGSSVTLTIVTEVLSVGNITNPVEVNSSTPDSNKTNNKANNTTEASEICDLELVKSSDKKVYRVGDTMHWIIEVVNHGPCTAKGVWVSDVMPSGVKYIGYSASKGKYDKATGNWTIGNLAKGEKVTLDILCKVISPGLITNNANVTTSVNESDLTNNFDNATVKVVKNDEPVPPTPKPDVPVPEPIPEPENPVPQTTMHATGNPLAFLLVAIFAIFGAFWSRKEQE